MRFVSNISSTVAAGIELKKKKILKSVFNDEDDRY